MKKAAKSLSYSPRLKKKYLEDIFPKIKKELGLANNMEVPKIKKICINQGIGKYASDKKLVDLFLQEVTTISGQKAVLALSKIDVSNFKLRKGMPVGVRVTLRGDKMYEFLDRLISISIPRIRDFRGINPKAFDSKGNYNLGITEQIIFPEIDIDKVGKITGLNISIVTSTDNKDHSYLLLKELGIPFKEN